MTPRRNLAVEEPALLEARLDVGRGQRRDGAPTHARRQLRERADRAAGGVADLLGARRLALPQRLVGLGIGQVDRERRPVVDGHRAPQRQPEQIEEVAAGAERILVRRVVARAGNAGRDQRRAIAQLGGQPRAARFMRFASGNERKHADQYSARRRVHLFWWRGGRGGGGLAVAPSSGQACLG